MQSTSPLHDEQCGVYLMGAVALKEKFPTDVGGLSSHNDQHMFLVALVPACNFKVRVSKLQLHSGQRNFCCIVRSYQAFKFVIWTAIFLKDATVVTFASSDTILSATIFATGSA